MPPPHQHCHSRRATIQDGVQYRGQSASVLLLTPMLSLLPGLCPLTAADSSSGPTAHALHNPLSRSTQIAAGLHAALASHLRALPGGARAQAGSGLRLRRRPSVSLSAPAFSPMTHADVTSLSFHHHLHITTTSIALLVISDRLDSDQPLLFPHRTRFTSHASPT